MSSDQSDRPAEAGPARAATPAPAALRASWPSGRPRRAAWERFTLLDMMLVVSAWGLGLAVVGTLLTFNLVPRPPEPLRSWFYLGLSGVIAPPIGMVLILLVHWMHHGRRTVFNPGEWYTISQGLLILTLPLFISFAGWLSLGVWLLAEASGMVAATFALVGAVRDWQRPGICHWTNVAGCVYSALAGGLLLVAVGFVLAFG